MFAVLEPVADRRHPARLRRRTAAAERIRVSVPGGASFFVLRIPVRGGTADGRRIRDAVGGTPLLLPDGLQIPDDPPLRVFQPRRLPLLCAAQTAAEWLRRQNTPLSPLGVLDPHGALRGNTACLLTAASDVRIATDRPGRFADDVHFAMQTYGAALTVDRSASILRGCRALLCGNADGVPGAETVFCLTQTVYRTDTIRLTGFRLPEPYRSLCPPQTDPLRFAAALYELCGVRSLARCRFSLP